MGVLKWSNELLKLATQLKGTQGSRLIIVVVVWVGEVKIYEAAAAVGRAMEDKMKLSSAQNIY